MKNIVSAFMVTLIVVSAFVSTFSSQAARAAGTIYIKADGLVDPPTAPIQRDGNVQSAFKDNIFGKALGVGGNNTAVASAGNTTDTQPRVLEHRITALELERLKRFVGVSQKESCDAKVVNDHGAGLRAPTEEEWVQIAASANIVEAIYLESQAPENVDCSNSPWFPPIGDQDGENSCLAWAIGYYMKTFQEAKEHDWNLTDARWEGAYPSPEYQDKIISPAFIYHLTNWGVNGWTYYFTVINLVCSIGACSWAKMPWDPSEHANWPSEDAWREAAYYRGASTGYEAMSVSSDDGILNLKNWIASENLAVIGVDCSQYSSLTSDDLWTVDNYAGGSNHANTIVGYDDNFTYLEGGQLSKGAFKIANSWGVGGWERVSDGFYWLSYKAMSEKVGYVMFYRDRIGYVPTLTSSFSMEHPMRGECNIVVGMGTHENPNVSKCFNDYICGGDKPFCDNRIVFDITEFQDIIPDVKPQPCFMRVYDGGTSATGMILYFAVQNVASDNPPVTTVNGNYVFVDLTLKETIYIRADGSMEPNTVPIQQEGSLYTLTRDITDYDGIVVERNNIVIDGAGYALQGSGSGTGFYWSGIHNVTIKNTSIKNFEYGIGLESSSNNSISGNSMTANRLHGIWLDYSSSNAISGNNITENSNGILLEHSSDYNVISGNRIAHNGIGILLYSSSNNRVFHNNLINNNFQLYSSNSVSIWDDGYSSGGNYWSDYTGVDKKSGPNQDQPGSDGIGDTPYAINADNQDRYPLMKPYPWDSHDVGITNLDLSRTIIGQGYTLHVNVTILNYGNITEYFNVTVYANTTIIYTFENIPLTSRNSTTLTFTWNTNGFVRGNYTLSAVADTVPGETDTTDNTFDRWAFVTLAGDVDGNRQVNIFDIVKMAGVYGVKEPDPRYEPNWDIDSDGDIDIFDIVIAAGNYGKSW